jgi:hypothetical protein
MGWIKGTNSFELIESNTLDRHWIANIEAKANAEQAHARSTLERRWAETPPTFFRTKQDHWAI